MAGYDFCTEAICDVLKYSLRKLKIIGKDLGYLPLLFENELRNRAIGEEINRKGAANYVHGMSPVPMPPRAGKLILQASCRK